MNVRFLLTALAVLGFACAALAADPAALYQQHQALGTAAKADLDAAKAKIDQMDAIAKQLRDAVPVEPPPPPPPPPPPGEIEITTSAPYLNALITVNPAYCGDRYNRYQVVPVLNGPTWNSEMFGNDDALGICSISQASGGKIAPWLYPTFALEIGGVEVARGAAKEGTAYIKLPKVPVPDLPDGWHKVKVYAYTDAGEKIDLAGRNPDFYVVIDKGGTAKDVDHFYIVSNNYGYVRLEGQKHRVIKVPKALIAAKPKPIPPRTVTPFDEKLPSSQIWRTNVHPVRHEDIYRPVITKEGVTVAANKHGYFFNDIYSEYPALPRLDGPRGVAALYMPTHVKFGRHNQVYIGYGQGIVRLDLDGHMKTLLGWRHKAPTYWADAAKGFNQELVGDWRVEPKGVRDLWGFDWVKKSLAVNDNAPPIGDEQPHVEGPTLLLADSMHDRLLRAVFSPVDRDVQPVIWPCVDFPGGDPWDVVIDDDDIAYVTLRGQSVIARVNAQTCERLPDLVANDSPIGIKIDNNRVAHATSGTLEQRRAAKILGPEGIDLQSDGKLVVLSSVQEAAWTFDRHTGERGFRAFPIRSTSAKSAFSKGAVARSGFGPKDALIVTTWSETQHGRPIIYLPPKPDGTVETWNFHELGLTAEGHTGSNPGGYAAACGTAPGILGCGTAQEGFGIFTKRLPTDVMPDLKAYKAGREKYIADGDRVIHGDEGFGFLNLPLPCNDNVKRPYLVANGHAC